MPSFWEPYDFPGGLRSSFVKAEGGLSPFAANHLGGANGGKAIPHG